MFKGLFRPKPFSVFMTWGWIWLQPEGSTRGTPVGPPAGAGGRASIPSGAGTRQAPPLSPSVPGPLLPPLRAAGKHSPAPLRRGAADPVSPSPAGVSRGRGGRLRGGRCCRSRGSRVPGGHSLCCRLDVFYPFFINASCREITNFLHCPRCEATPGTEW